MTSNLILPPGLVVPPGVTKPPVDEEFENTPMEDRAKQIPQPTGYKLLCVIPDAEDTFENSSIIKADVVKRNEEVGTVVLFVVSMGPDAYKDTTKFPTGPWCKEGDFVLTRTYAGTRIKIRGKEFRLINDDMVEATVDDPRGISRAAA
jgi:co-chaperonin GroES (HSP10)